MSNYTAPNTLSPPCPSCGRYGAHFCPGPPTEPMEWGLKPPCIHPEHNPPMHLYIAPGTSYVHVCPWCGYSVLMAPPYVT